MPVQGGGPHLVLPGVRLQPPDASDALLSRGRMGDGVIDFSHCTRAVTSAGYTGDIEVEIFNAEIWEREPREVVSQMVERYDSLVACFLSGPGPTSLRVRLTRPDRRQSTGAHWSGRRRASGCPFGGVAP